ncbi:hypothetical protein GOODEAATRI_019762, partial [Goodea atripinnis]
EGSGDIISHCLRGGIVRFPPSIEDSQCLIEAIPLRGISLLAGRKWLAAVASPPEEDGCRKGRWTAGFGPGSHDRDRGSPRRWHAGHSP